MRYLLTYSVIFILIIGCKSQSPNNKIDNFDSFINNIPTLDLPYRTSCGACCDRLKLNLDSSFIHQYNLGGIDAVGKLNISDKYVGILYAGGGDYYVPFIVIYDIKGNKITEKGFMGDYCGSILDFYGDYILDIDNNMQIIETDTKIYFKVDSVTHDRMDTLKKTISISKFQIEKDGRIIDMK